MHLIKLQIIRLILLFIALSSHYPVLSERAQFENSRWHVAKLVQQFCHRLGNFIRSNNTENEDSETIHSRKVAQRYSILLILVLKSFTGLVIPR